MKCTQTLAVCCTGEHDADNEPRVSSRGATQSGFTLSRWIGQGWWRSNSQTSSRLDDSSLRSTSSTLRTRVVSSSGQLVGVSTRGHSAVLSSGAGVSLLNTILFFSWTDAYELQDLFSVLVIKYSSRSIPLTEHKHMFDFLGPVSWSVTDWTGGRQQYVLTFTACILRTGARPAGSTAPKRSRSPAALTRDQKTMKTTPPKVLVRIPQWHANPWGREGRMLLHFSEPALSSLCEETRKRSAWPWLRHGCCVCSDGLFFASISNSGITVTVL